MKVNLPRGGVAGRLKEQRGNAISHFLNLIIFTFIKNFKSSTGSASVLILVRISII